MKYPELGKVGNLLMLFFVSCFYIELCNHRLILL